ncbi:MAG: hypothetical protein ACYCZU_09740 [Devosia sp.]
MFKTIRLLVLAFAALAGTVAAAHAATITVVSMRYSAAQPVPHIHYEGDTAVGDVEALQAVYDQFVKCRTACLGPDGASTAVLTLNGPGGSYGTGLDLADFLRLNHIATVVERGASCYSACAFAFLGGSGWSSQEGMGDYIDRVIEPGGIVGFHAPYRDEASFLEALQERGAGPMMDETRDSLSLMVKELVKWNVDPEILFYMVGMAPDQTYDIVNADDYYLIRAALPPTPTSAWITDVASAVKNACIRLIAIDERTDPLTLQERISAPYEENIGVAEFGGALSGYRLSDRLLDVGHCSITEQSAATGGDYEISLYMNPGVTQFSGPMLTFFNRGQGWSTAGSGGNPVKRILQKGAMNHYFLPVGTNVDALDLPGEMAILRNRFFSDALPMLPIMSAELNVDQTSPISRVSHSGDVWVFEQVGDRKLFESAVADTGLGVTYSNNGVGPTGYVREGTYDDTGASFASFGFLNGEASAVVTVLVAPPDGSAATDAHRALIRRIQCAAEFSGMQLGCG